MEECEICKVRRAMAKSTLCKNCSDHYGSLLRSAASRTRTVIEHSSIHERNLVGNNDSEPQRVAQAVLEPPEQVTPEIEPQMEELPSPVSRRPPWNLIGSFMLIVGVLALAFAVVLASTVLAFIGLGMTFWGVLVFFIRPQDYVRTDLMNATAVSSLKTIDKIMLGLGYRERGVYIPIEGPEKTVVFVPTEPFSMIPEGKMVEGKTFLDKPEGLLITPPGLALAKLIEARLGFDLRNCGLDVLVRTLPKVLVEDLEAVKDVEIEVKGDFVKVKLVDSLYADFCREVRESSRRCALGCPMCSALACVLTIASGKPIAFEDEKSLSDKKTTESYYHLLSQKRL